MLNNLMLMAGIDIPFPQAQICIHQPKIKEIAFIGEESFFLGCETLNFSKKMLATEDKVNLDNKTNFDILMSIIKDAKNPSIQKNRICVMLVLTLIFPNCSIKFSKDSIDIIEEEDKTKIHKINNSNFESFKEIIIKMFCLDQNDQNESCDYNPSGAMAEAIAAKLKAGRAAVSKAKGEKKNIDIISRYMSILSIGNKESFENLNNYTIYQLFDSFKRFKMKDEFEFYLKAKLAGAQDLEEVDNWMKDLHSES